MIFAEISPLHDAAASQSVESQISPLHIAAGRQIFLLHFVARRPDKKD
jgi:hypothetical protein